MMWLFTPVYQKVFYIQKLFYKEKNMKKKLFLALLMVSLFACIFAIGVNAITQAEADEAYYEKVYVTANGEKTLPLYEKVGDTYYPLAWFAYDVLGEDGTTVVETKYVKAYFEDVTCYSEAYSQGRFNGVYYEYTDENGNEMVLNSNHAVLLNLRSGVMSNTMKSDGTQKATNITIKTFEWSKSGYPSFTKLEAVYIPLSATVACAPSSVRVFDIDRNHGAISMGTKAFQYGKIKEIFIPGNTTFPANSNSQFQQANSLETVIFGKGFDENIPNYFFQATKLKKVFFMGTESELDAITVSTTQNAPYFALTKKSFSDYMTLSETEREDGKYLVYDVPECYVWGHTNTVINACVSQCTLCGEKTVNHVDNDSITVSAEFDSYLSDGKKVTACHMEGCLYTKEETMDALFTSKGFSKDNVNANGIVIAFSVNKEAIEKYEAITQKTVTFGLFVALESTLDDNNGTVNLKDENVAGVLKAEMPQNYFAYVGLKLHGFDNEEKQASPFAIGAYTIVNDEISFVQLNSTDAKVPVFTTYAEIIASIKE